MQNLFSIMVLTADPTLRILLIFAIKSFIKTLAADASALALFIPLA